MTDLPVRLATAIEHALAAHAKAERVAVLSGGYAPSALRHLGVSVPDLRGVVRRFSRETRSARPREIIALALRSLVPHDPAAVRAFLERHGAKLPAVVRREATAKLDTGRKQRATTRSSRGAGSGPKPTTAVPTRRTRRGRPSPFAPLLGESGVLAEEDQRHEPGGPPAVPGQDELDVLHGGALLDGAGLAQVGEHGALAPALLTARLSCESATTGT